MQRLSCVSDEHPLQVHLPSKPIILTWCDLSPWRPGNEHAEASPVSLTYGLFNTIIPVTLSYQLSELSLPEDLKKYAEASQMLLTNDLLKTMFQVKLSTGWALSPMKRGQWICTVDSSTVSPMNCLFKTSSKQSYLFKGYVPKETWTVNEHSRVFSRVTDGKPFQGHLPRKYILVIKSSVSWENWTVNIQSSLLLYCWQMAFSRPSFQ